jgi:DNA-binding NarL/FixJ family response regulator
MTREPIATLIIAPPGRFRDSLRVLLRAGNMITLSGQASDMSTALQLVDVHHPALVLMDADLQSGDVWRALRQLRREYPQIRVIVFTHTSQQSREAQQAPADAVLADGFTTRQLFETILAISEKEKE